MKVIQISLGNTPTGHSLYALTDDGRLWVKSVDETEWRNLATPLDEILDRPDEIDLNDVEFQKVDKMFV